MLKLSRIRDLQANPKGIEYKVLYINVINRSRYSKIFNISVIGPMAKVRPLIPEDIEVPNLYKFEST